MRDDRDEIETGHETPTTDRNSRRPTELKVAYDCLLYYLGMLAFGQPTGTFEACAERHYARSGLILDEHRLGLLDALRPLLIDGGMADLTHCELVLQLQALGWEPSYLKRKIR